MNQPQPESTKIPQSSIPSDDNSVQDWLRLYRSRRVGPMTFIRLIREYKTATAALAALPEVAAAAGASNYQACSKDAAEMELELGKSHGAQLLCLGMPEYPPMLATIPDPPAVLWALGDPTLATRSCIAIVGARNASSIGRRMAARLALELSEEGYVVVSGLARGIDTEAHNSSIGNGTIAIHAGGVNVIYPKENITLAEHISSQGLRLSEMPMGTQPQARHFPRRNRIISGISQGVVIIEGASRSGSLITAKDALDQGREVMAVPGSPLDPRATGCNMLIRDGATLIRSAADIIEAIGPPQAAPPPTPDPIKVEPIADLSKALLSLLGPTPVSEDVLIRQSNFSAQRVLASLQYLEISKKIKRNQEGIIASVV